MRSQARRTTEEKERRCIAIALFYEEAFSEAAPRLRECGEHQLAMEAHWKAGTDADLEALVKLGVGEPKLQRFEWLCARWWTEGRALGLTLKLVPEIEGIANDFNSAPRFTEDKTFRKMVKRLLSELVDHRTDGLGQDKWPLWPSSQRVWLR